jgi:hypothetical protein
MDELGDDATYQEMLDAKTKLRLAAGDDYSEQQRINEMGSAYLKMMGEAEATRQQAQAMYTEADNAQAELEVYQTKLAERLGITEEELKEATGLVNQFKEAISSIPEDVYTRMHVITEEGEGGGEEDGSHAIGGVIPYNNYHALLHRGEKVLTATEVRRGEGSGMDYGHLEDRIAAAIRSGMNGATVRSFLNGRDVTAEVNRNNIRDVKGRRFAT